MSSKEHTCFHGLEGSSIHGQRYRGALVQLGAHSEMLLAIENLWCQQRMVRYLQGGGWCPFYGNLSMFMNLPSFLPEEVERPSDCGNLNMKPTLLMLKYTAWPWRV